jgi:hypothetical protein
VDIVESQHQSRRRTRNFVNIESGDRRFALHYDVEHATAFTARRPTGSGDTEVNLREVQDYRIIRVRRDGKVVRESAAPALGLVQLIIFGSRDRDHFRVGVASGRERIGVPCLPTRRYC